MNIRRRISGWLHRFAWWCDRRADDIWNIDEFVDLPSHPAPPPEELSQAPQDAFADLLQFHPSYRGQ